MEIVNFEVGRIGGGIVRIILVKCITRIIDVYP